MNKNYVHTLAYNLVSETQKSINRLYNLNYPKEFNYFIVDLGFPLIDGDKIPYDIEIVKHSNSLILKGFAKSYPNSNYLKFSNIGVSQNWTTVYRYLRSIHGFDDTDILIGADPDERPITKNWIRAMRRVIDGDPTIGVVSLMMTDHLQFVDRWKQDDMFSERDINGERAWFFRGNLNWALIGINGEFLNKLKEIPVPHQAEKYGWLEAELVVKLKEMRYSWCVLPEYLVEHTDYERNSPGSSKLYREWKNEQVFKLKETGFQVDFEEWLIKKRNQNG